MTHHVLRIFVAISLSLSIFLPLSAQADPSLREMKRAASKVKKRTRKLSEVKGKGSSRDNAYVDRVRRAENNSGDLVDRTPVRVTRDSDGITVIDNSPDVQTNKGDKGGGKVEPGGGKKGPKPGELPSEPVGDQEPGTQGGMVPSYPKPGPARPHTGGSGPKAEGKSGPYNTDLTR